MNSLKSYGFLLVMLMFGLTASAQLQVDPGYTPQQLVEDVLIGGGVQVSNSQFSGNGQARGYFDGTNSNVGLESGIIISTGRVDDAPGPNGTPISDQGTQFNGTGDPALTALSGDPTFDAAYLEFDFVPSSDTVQFNYVFASNEYMLYVGTGVNDAFAFLISGPGIVGEQNVALIPGTATPVTIDNLSANTNSQFYIDNENPPGSTVEYNGFTQVMTATAILTPCETYHIRLAIADGGDEFFDSAVFLEAGSFTSPSVSLNAESTYSASGSAQELVEGCSSMTLTFERSAPLDDPLSIGLTFSGSASVGLDISNIPTAITFAAGSATSTISFDVLDDGQVEGVEDMTITLDQLNPCATGPATSVTFTIEDVDPMILTITPPITVTCPAEQTLDVTVAGGYADFTYDWSTSETTASITVFPLVTTFYTVEVTDACGFTETITTNVNTGGYVPLSIVVDEVIVCGGEEAILVAQPSGGLEPYSFTWNSAGGGDTYSYFPTESGMVAVTVQDNCSLSASTNASVVVDAVGANFDAELARHDIVQFTNTSDDAWYFLWDFGDGETSDLESPRHTYLEEGTYTVIMYVENGNGCTDSTSKEVTVYAPLHVYIPNTFTPNGDGLNDMFGMVGEGYLYYDLEIFDRWGNRMRHGRFRDDTAWDGTYKGKTVPSGMYTYWIWVQPPIGIEIREAGILYVLPGE